jgi:hypothetical protein
MKLQGLVSFGAICAIVGALLMWAFTRPSGDWQERADAWEKQAKAWHSVTLNIFNARRNAEIRIRDSAMAVADSAKVKAAMAGAGRLFYKGRADSLQALLDKTTSTTSPDSALTICRETLSARSSEASSCADQVVQLERAVKADSTAIRAANQALEIERAAHDTTKALLLRGRSLVNEAPRTDCGLPLCLSVSPIYQWNQKELLLTFTLPVGWRWLRPGAGTSIGSLR